MEHSFNTEIAKKYGIHAAIILKNIYFWVEHNRANEKHYHDGYYWTYNSVKAFRDLFDYMSKSQINTALSKLIEDGIIITGNYNSNHWDKTKWYAITAKGMELLGEVSNGENSISENESIDCPKIGNHINNNILNKYISTDINTYSNTNIDTSPNESSTNRGIDFSDFFERMWKLYPRKEGKGQVSDAKKRKLMTEVGEEQMVRCIERFKEAKRGTDPKYIMMGSTFFNSGYVDYLDDNYGYTDTGTTANKQDDYYQ